MWLHIVCLSMLLLQSQHVATHSLSVYAVVTDTTCGYNMWLHVVQLSMLLLQTQRVATCSLAVYAVVTDTTCGYM